MSAEVTVLNPVCKLVAKTVVCGAYEPGVRLHPAVMMKDMRCKRMYNRGSM